MITEFLSNEIIQALAWTIIHSIWQITIIAIGLSLFFRFGKSFDSRKKYLVSIGALLLSCLCSLITFASYYGNAFVPNSIIEQNLIHTAHISAQDLNSHWLLDLSIMNKYVLAIVNAWMIGSILFFIRFIGGFIYLKRIIKKSSLQNEKLLDIYKKLNKKFSIHRSIKIRESALVTSPMVFGYIKPVILFPLGVVNMLSTSEVEAILAHELAHIKRHDYLVNLFQIFSEIIFYFHPGIWYISSRIRFERENCCDDMAIEYTKNSLTYAKTLVKMQELNIKNIKPGLAFSGDKNAFSNRVKRLLGSPIEYKYSKDKVLLFTFLFCTAFLMANSNDKEDKKEAPFDIYLIDDCPQGPDQIRNYLDTIPDQTSFKIKKKSNDHDIEMEMENGEITKLIIEGKTIPESQYNSHQDIINDLKPGNSKEIITLFPECHDELGRIYYLDRFNDKVVNLDSIYDELKEKTKHLQSHDFGFLEFDFNDEFEDILVDTVKQRLFDFEDFYTDFQKGYKPKFDSIFESLGLQVPQGTSHSFKYFGDEKGSPWHNELHTHLDSILKGNGDSWVFEHFDKNEKGFPFHNEQLDSLLNGQINNWSFKYFDDQIHAPLEEYFDMKKMLPEGFDIHKSFPNRITDEFLKPEKTSDIIAKSLMRDQLIDPSTSTKIEITGKHLKIDGEKQPSNFWRKYKNIYESSTGIKITSKSKVEIILEPSKLKNYSKKGFSI